MKNFIVFVVALSLLGTSFIGFAQEQPRVVVIPLTETVMPAATPETIVSASGEWSAAGLALPPMILKDLYFYVESDTSPPCEFSMNYVIDQSTSRTIRRFSLNTAGSVQVNFESGVNTSDLRFGTIGGGTCVRHWAAFGYQLP